MADEDRDCERVGVIVVHGIGEQRRFEHIDGQVRAIVAALRQRNGATVTVDIASATATGFRAEQDTWGAAPTVEVAIDDPSAGKKMLIDFHEVWWADVNEPYSFAKQLRFWWWGLTVWIYPNKLDSALPGAVSVRPPIHQGRSVGVDSFWVRARLFGVGVVAVVGATSVGMLTFLAERVLNLRPPNFVRVFVNYVAGVKLFNQKRRMGAGPPWKEQNFLDALKDPPRVSVRRRMIRTIADVAERDYDRWYVLAHSLGTVVAFNGLMEASRAWPGYFDRDRWNSLRAPAECPPLVGPADPNAPQPPPGKSMPERPAWARPDDIAYRSRIFRQFHGLLTFGSPLEKFATLWPARVPISLEPAFREGTEWLNVYDPIDPVSGILASFSDAPPNCCPAPRNVGFAAGSVLLMNHLQYLDEARHHPTLVDGVAEWLITGNSRWIRDNLGPGWFPPGMAQHKRRTFVAWMTWIVVILGLAGLGGVVFPTVWSLAGDAGWALWSNIACRVDATALKDCPKILSKGG